MKTYYSCAPIEQGGYLLLTATETSITGLRLLADKRACDAVVHNGEHLPKRDERSLQPFRDSVLAYLRGDIKEIIDVPFSIAELAASPFRRRVWELLMEIPRGKTMSYKEIAGQLGNAHKARAVGGACAANPVAIIIPCHRVVPHSQGLGGYRWGLDWKKKLLSIEGVALI